jgi:hypothetical protein
MKKRCQGSSESRTLQNSRAREGLRLASSWVLEESLNLYRKVSANLKPSSTEEDRHRATLNLETHLDESPLLVDPRET